MKTRAKVMTIMVVAVSMFYWSTASSQPERSDDRTLSPYFFVQSAESSLDQLPLKSTAAVKKWRFPVTAQGGETRVTIRIDMT
jgi:hypothetical protein